MSFYTSLSGLQAAQTDMSTISHNLANVATNGFKKSRSQFADVIASSFTTDPRRMVGSGAVLQQNRQEFGEGSLRTTTSGLDLAISGEGFFAVRSPGSNGAVNYTRNGGFLVDANRYVVDANGSFLQAYPVDGEGNATASGSDGLVNVQIPETSGVAKATASVATAVNLSTAAKSPTVAFNRGNPTTYNNSTTSTIYDAAGNAMTLTSYYVRNEAADANGADAWDVYSYVGDEALTTGGAASARVTFNAAGNLATPAGAIAFDAFTPGGSGTPQSVSLNLAGSTERGTTFAVGAKSQDGSTVGQLSGVSVDGGGTIVATFTNGDSRALGKVALATFVNPTGLRQTGSSYWSSTGISGAPELGAAGENGNGKLMSGTIEGSNVDITEELVNLIAAQRNFQANAKALDTQSQISETIFNIRS